MEGAVGSPAIICILLKSTGALNNVLIKSACSKSVVLLHPSLAWNNVDVGLR